MKRVFSLAALVLAAAAVSACDETLEGGIGCGILCPERPSEIRQDTLAAVTLDTTLGGFPATGTEQVLLLARRGDTLDARAVVRFDSLPATYRKVNSTVDDSIVYVDSAMLELRVVNLDTLAPVVTVEAYDVDMQSGDDTTAAALTPLFAPSRLLGSVTFDPAAKNDTLRVPIDSAKLRALIQTDSARRLRIGLRLTSAESTELLLHATNGGGLPTLSFLPAPDSGTARVVLGPMSKTPDNIAFSADLADFQIISVAPPAAPPGVLRVGGLPGSRVYLRFDIPARILDSSTVVRAELQLTQRPNREGAASADTAAIEPYLIAAGSAITDLRRALLFLAVAFDSVHLVPSDSGMRSIEIIQVVRSWRGTRPERTPRALALRATTEGITPWQADFFSIDAPAAVRPRLIVTYVPLSAPRVP